MLKFHQGDLVVGPAVLYQPHWGRKVIPSCRNAYRGAAIRFSGTAVA